MRSTFALLVVFSALAAGTARDAGDDIRERPSTPGAHRVGPKTHFTGLPIAFEANRGQTDARVRFLARAAGETLFVEPAETVMALRGRAVRMRLVGADESAEVAGLDRLPGTANYFRGNDPTRWIGDVPTYARVACRGVWPGIDVVWYGEANRLEYDFVLAPGADPSAIGLAFDGADSVALDADGDLRLIAGDATLVQRRPLVWETVDGARREVDGRYVLEDGSRVRFEVAGHDASLPLRIDPVVYATYLGGSGETSLERVFGVTRDAAGNTYLTGDTTAPDFPLVGAFDGTYAGSGAIARGDVFVSKIDPTGTTLLFSTYLGGTSDDEGYGIGVDATGVYVAGQTYSTNFPTTPGVVEEASPGAAHGFVTKLAPSGASLVWSTYVGATTPGGGFYDMALDSAGHVFAVGGSYPNFPTTAGAYQTSNAGIEDIVVVELDADATSLLWSTYVGGGGEDRGHSIAISGAGDVYFMGNSTSGNFPVPGPAHGSLSGSFDAVVGCLAAGGASLTWATYLGGAGVDEGIEVKLDSLGNVYAAGSTASGNFSVKSPLQNSTGGFSDAFVAKFTPAGVLTWATYLGGSGDDVAHGLAVDASDRPVVAGYTQSPDFPLAGAPRTVPQGRDGFITTLDAAGTTIVASTYVGGHGDDQPFEVILGSDGTPFVAGTTTSTDLPTTAGVVQPSIAGALDAFLSTAPPPPVPPAIQSYFLPKKVLARANASDASKSALAATGFFDMGPAPLDLAHPATLDLGNLHVDVPGFAQRGTRFAFTSGGLTVEIVPNPHGSSRAKFRLKRTGDLAGVVPQNGQLTVSFSNDVVDDAHCRLTMTNGTFGLGRVRGALAEPNVFVQRARAKIVGGGKDALSLVVGLATNGTAPSAAADLHVAFGSLDATIPAASFTRSGDVFTFKGNVNGVTSVTLDYAKEQIRVTAKNAALGPFAEGGNSTTIVVGLGTDQRAVAVRTSKSGTTLKY